MLLLRFCEELGDYMVLENRGWAWSFFRGPFLPSQAQAQKPFLRLLRAPDAVSSVTDTTAQQPRCNALASAGLVTSLDYILPFSCPVSGDPSRLRAFGHSHLHPHSLGWARSSFNAPRPEVEDKP